MPMPTIYPPVVAASPLASVRPHHAGVRVADLDAAIDWYTRTLDFRVMHTMTLGERHFVYLAPAVHDTFWIELLGGQPTAALEPPEGTSRAGWDHICLQVDSADDMIAELRRRGANILREPFDVPTISRRIAFFADPWDNTFEIFQVIEP